jgi:hypothetical protein
MQVADEVAITMPEASRLLHVAVQGHAPQADEMVLWAEVDTEEPPEVRTFRIYGTGHAMPEDQPLHHVATVQMYEGRLVWHVYELRSPEHYQRREVVAEASNEPGWIGEAHGPPQDDKAAPEFTAEHPWMDKPRGGGNGQ